MKITYLDEKMIVRLERGELLKQTLLEAFNDLNIDGGSLYGIGGAVWADLGYYNLDEKKYHFKRFAGPLEIASLTGFIARDSDNEIVLHAHATISGADLNASAGHVKEIKIAGTCELIIEPMKSLKRSLDEDTGLELLDLGQ